MFKTVRTGILSLLLCCIHISTKAQPLLPLFDDVTYLWPTNASQQISSTFGETRSAHLHAGLDIRTYGREGFKVFATRDGIVHRIGTGPHGYGNVLYLKHDDGTYSVYAHLNRFEPDLQAYTDSIRFIDYRFSIDRIVESDSIFYEQGDVIAYTGSTGVGPPHLHFELRTQDFKPFNPLLTNLTIQDTVPPEFRQLAVEFKNNQTLHPENFDIYHAVFRNGRFDFGEIKVNGPIGLSVDVYDRANATPNFYAVHSLIMKHQSDTLFHSEANYFSYQHAGHMFLDRSYQILAQMRRGFQRLFVVKGNELPFYLKAVNKGVLNFPDGKWPIEIIASDIFGNRSKATVTLVVDEHNNDISDSISHVPTYPSIPNSITNQFHAFYNRVIGHQFNNHSQLGSTPGANAKSAEKTFIPYRINPDFSIEMELNADARNILSSPDKKLWIEFPENTLYDNLTLKMNINHTDEGIFINFTPNRLPIQGSIHLHYILPPELTENNKLAAYSVDTYRNRKFFIGSNLSDGILRVNMREINDVLITEDNQPPRIGNVRIGKDLAGNYLVIFPARDSESGINYQESQIIVNGEKGLTKYDPDKNQLYFYKPGFTPQKTNSVQITAYDGVGNKTEKKVSFRYSP